METKPEPDPPQAPHTPDAAKTAPVSKPKKESEWDFRAAMPVIAVALWSVMCNNDRPKTSDMPRPAPKVAKAELGPMPRLVPRPLDGDPKIWRETHAHLVDLRIRYAEQIRQFRMDGGQDAERRKALAGGLKNFNSGVRELNEPRRLSDGTVLDPVLPLELP